MIENEELLNRISAEMNKSIVEYASAQACIQSNMEMYSRMVIIYTQSILEANADVPNTELVAACESRIADYIAVILATEQSAVDFYYVNYHTGCTSLYFYC